MRQPARSLRPRQPRTLRAVTCLMLAALALGATACEKKESAPAEQPANAQAEQPAPAPPEKIKLTFAFQPQENPTGLALDARKMADFIAQKTGYEAEVFLPTSYAAVVEALRAKNADVAYFSGWPYLVAHARAGVELLVVEERKGQPFYYSQWYVLKDSPYQSMADLKGKNIAFTSPTSTSGYLFPLAKVVEEGHLQPGQDPKAFFGDVLFAGGYQQALLALVNGTVDAAAASDYAFGMYLDESQQARVRVLTKQGPVPTHGIAIRSELPQEVKDRVKAALLELNATEHKDLLKSVYGAEKLVERSHQEHVEALDKAVKATATEYPL